MNKNNSLKRLLKKLWIIGMTLGMISPSIWAQENTKLSLQDAIGIASRQSLDAFIQKNTYLGSYWQFRNYRSDLLPQLTLASTPLSYGSTVQKQYDVNQNSDIYVSRKYLNSDLGVSLSQNIAATGGSVFLSSDLGYLKNYGDNENNYFSSNPISIGFQQTLNGYNPLKWRSKIEPLKYEIAKKQYLQSRENISVKTVSKFFALVDAQIELNISTNNLSNADTLYQIGQGRFKAGTITQDELLSLQLSLMNAKLSLAKAKQGVIRASSDLNSFLGLAENTPLECILPDQTPTMEIDAQKAISLALTNSTDILNYQQSELEAQQNVKEAVSKSGMSAQISAKYGLSKASESLQEAYSNPNQSQQISVGLNLPLLDWGKAKGTVAVAKSNQQVIENRIKQQRIDLQQNVMMNVMEFNLQSQQVVNAAQADTIAQLGYEVTIQRFKIGKLDVLNLNSARNDLQNAKRAYISSLRQYWNYYYTLRGMTLFDFVKNEELGEDFSVLEHQ